MTNLRSVNCQLMVSYLSVNLMFEADSSRAAVQGKEGDRQLLYTMPIPLPLQQCSAVLD